MDKKRILVMEDSETFAEIICDFFAENGFEVAHAANGFEGIKETYHFKPHLIVCDLEMPMCNGYQAVRFLRSRTTTRKIPIMLLTKLSDTKDRYRGLDAGADSYVEKLPGNFELILGEAIRLINEKSGETDYEAIAREAYRINDESVVEGINNLLDESLSLTTLIAKIAQSRIVPLDNVIIKTLELLSAICDVQIAAVIIAWRNEIFIYTANRGDLPYEIAEDFLAGVRADFDKDFPDAPRSVGEEEDLTESAQFTEETETEKLAKSHKKVLESYFTYKLHNLGKPFALMAIANTATEYFSPPITESLGTFLNAAAPTIVNALLMREIKTTQKKTRRAFAKYVPPSVVDEIIESGGDMSVTGEALKIAVLFCDIRKFTKISEKTNAQDLVVFLNNYFLHIGNAVVEQGGQIDKYIGDGLMAIFGAPRPLKNAAANAIHAAINMLSTLPRVNTSPIDLGGAELDIGIGINYGECVVGNIGFASKQEYTAIGDEVNLASRLESLTKVYAHPILASESVYEEISADKNAKDRYIFRKADFVRVVGKEKAVGVYAVYKAFEEDAGKGRLHISRALLEPYNKALSLVKIREFKSARRYLREALDVAPGDYLSTLYLDRVEYFIENPPHKGWDGTIVMENK
ncbi:MAG: response regulator [Helicobacteraceae bacterium]|jgi:class 3 adenylate cyclase/CheY-like chemotaxis protein|nr:response regulator [Helicobacteraceae bacterium]